jgi:hypothetical protein
MIITANLMKVRSIIMPVPDNHWTNNPKLRNIDPRKMAILLDLMRQAEGKPMEQMLPILMAANKRLQQQNMTFTKDETDVMLEVLTKNMSPKEKAQFEMVRKFMSTMR